MVQKQFEFFCHRQLQLAPMFYSTTTGGPRRPLVQRASARSSCKSGAGRALVVGDVFRRLVARALAQLFAIFAGAFQEACLPYQFGLSTRAGTEGLYKLLHTATELDPRATVLSIDAVGTYDHVSRQAMLEGLRSRPALVPLLPFARQFYGSASSYTWLDDNGGENDVVQGEGGEQGDPLMPALYSLAQCGFERGRCRTPRR